MTDLKQETERLLGLDIPPHIKIIFGDHEKHMAALQAENDALRVDAERYRWLRSEARWRWHGDNALAALEAGYESLDKAIDAASTSTAGAGG